MYEPRVFHRCLYASLAFRDLFLDAFRKRSGSRRPRARSLWRWPALRISLRNPARPYFVGLLGDGRMLAGPPIQVKCAHAQHRLDFRQSVGESFQRRRQPDHVGDTREIPWILDDRALLSKRRIVVTPDVTHRPILRLWACYIESGHQRLERGYIAFEFLGSDTRRLASVCIATRPVRVIEGPTACRLRRPYRQAAEGLGIHPTCCALDQLNDSRDVLPKCFVTVGYEKSVPHRLPPLRSLQRGLGVKAKRRISRKYVLQTILQFVEMFRKGEPKSRYRPLLPSATLCVAPWWWWKARPSHLLSRRLPPCLSSDSSSACSGSACFAG